MREALRTANFTPTEMTTTAGAASGNFLSYLSETIQGEIVKVSYNGGNLVNSGSVVLFVSGTNEPIWNATGRASGLFVEYPRVYPVDSTGTTGSPHIMSCRKVGGYDAQIGVWASGCGPGKSGIDLRIHYE